LTTTTSGGARIGQVATAGSPTTGFIAQGGEGFQGHVTGALDGPFVVLFEQNGSDMTRPKVRKVWLNF